MNTNLIGCSVAATLLAFSTMASAQSFYLQAEAGQSSYDVDLKDDTDTYFDLGVGYGVTENLAFEIGYKDYGEASESGGGYKASVETSSVSAAAVGILPLGPSFSLFGKIGFDIWEGTAKESLFGASDSVDDDGTDFFFGAGFAYNISESTDVHVSYESHSFDDLDVDVFAVGVNFGI